MLVPWLPAETDRRLDELARRTGQSKSCHAREAILEHLEDLEDTYLAEQAMQEYRASGGRAVSMNEILERHG